MHSVLLFAVLPSFVPEVTLSRRSALGAVAAAVTQAAGPVLPAAAATLTDPLVDGLEEARAELESLDLNDVDAVRRSLANLISLSTHKGYRGVSVKSRALELGELAGSKLTELRRTELLAIGRLDEHCYSRQRGLGALIDLGDAGELRAATLQALGDVLKEVRDSPVS